MAAAERPRRAATLLPLLLYAVLAVAFFARAWFSSPTALADGSGDAQQTVWFLSWVPWALEHGHNPFLTTHLNAPDGVNLMWNSLAPLLGVALWPITATVGAVVSYDLLVTADLALSAWCAFLLLRRYVRPPAALLGGAFYGFAPYLVAQAPSHSKVGFALLPPLLMLLVDDVVVRGRSPRRGGLLLGVLLAAQLLVYEEGFVLALVGGAVVLLVLAVRAGRERTRERLPQVGRALAWAVPPLLLIAGVPLAFQVFGPNRLPSIVPGGAVYVTDVASLVVPPASQWLSPARAQSLVAGFSGNSIENAGYLGLPLIAIALFTMVRCWRRAVVMVAAVSGLVLTLLSMGPQLHVAGHVSRLPLPWRAIQALPLFGSALPSRLFVYVDLAVAVLLAVFVEELLLTPARLPAARRAVGAAAAALAVVAVLPNPAAAAQVPVPDFFQGGFDALVPDGSTVLVAPWSHDGTTAQPMVWQAAADMGFAMPEGYFVNVDKDGTRADGPRPSTTSEVMTRIAAGAALPGPGVVDQQILRDLGHWRVQAVVVGPMPHQDRMLALLSRVLAQPPLHRGGVYVWSGLRPAALHTRPFIKS